MRMRAVFFIKSCGGEVVVEGELEGEGEGKQPGEVGRGLAPPARGCSVQTLTRHPLATYH